MPKYRHPNEFGTEKDYINYFNMFDFAARLEMASSFPIAQRLMAQAYERLNDVNESEFFWEKAANSKDPIAILRKTIRELEKNDFDQAMKTYLLARELCNNYYDPDGRSFLENHLHETRKSLIINLYARGQEKYSKKDVNGARADLTNCMMLGDPNGTYKLAEIYLLEKNYAKAKFLFKLALYFTNDLTFFNLNKDIVSKVREQAHLQLAEIQKLKLNQLMHSSSHIEKSTRKILSHLNKATAYGEEKKDKEKENDKKIQAELLNKIDPNQREKLLIDTTAIIFSNKVIVKTKYEIENTNFSDKKGLLSMLSYRKPKEKNNTGINIEDIEKNFTKHKLG